MGNRISQPAPLVRSMPPAQAEVTQIHDGYPRRASPPPQPSGPLAGLATRAGIKAPSSEASLSARPSRLLDLPKEVRDIITNQLPLRDAARMSSVCRDFRKPADARNVLRSALTALDAMPADQFAQERGSRMKPLAEVLDQAGTPERLHDHVCQLYAQMQGISSPVRAEVLVLIAERVHRMPEDERVDVMDGLASDALKVLRKADMQEPLQALARQISQYPPERRFNMVALYAYQNRIKDPSTGDGPLGSFVDSHVEPPQQAQVMAALAEAVKWTPDPPATWGYLLGETVKLVPAEHRKPVLDALEMQMNSLPPFRQVLAGLALANERARCQA